jgi:hypothetical protein
MTWADLVTLGQERFAAEPGEITDRVAALKPDDPLALLLHLGHHRPSEGRPAPHRNVLYAMVTVDAMGTVRWRSR